MKDEANWIDTEEKEEKPFILEGRRMSMSDIQVILEIAVKVSMIADSQVISSWLQNRHKMMIGVNKVPLGKVISEVHRAK